MTVTTSGSSSKDPASIGTTTKQRRFLVVDVYQVNYLKNTVGIRIPDQIGTVKSGLFEGGISNDPVSNGWALDIAIAIVPPIRNMDIFVQISGF